jgi:predicted lipoprotein with Yx(FWY)xxD motif
VPALAAAAVLGLTACGSGGGANSGGSLYGNASQSPSKVAAPASSGDALAVRQTSLGTILTDGRGFTLYAFDADKGTTSECTGACATAWPPATVTGASPKVGTGVTQSLVGESTRSDGSTQLTYAGRPLYLFEGDSKPGDTNGDGSTAFGARWDTLTPAGKDATGGS